MATVSNSRFFDREGNVCSREYAHYEAYSISGIFGGQTHVMIEVETGGMGEKRFWTLPALAGSSVLHKDGSIQGFSKNFGGSLKAHRVEGPNKVYAKIWHHVMKIPLPPE